MTESVIYLLTIEPQESIYFEVLKIKGQTNKPIGRIEDIEIIFLHYNSKEEAYEKWNKRIKRVNHSNLIVKFSEQNLCEYEDLVAFVNLPYKNKICFVKKDYKMPYCIKLPFYSKCVSLLDDIPDYRIKIKQIRNMVHL